MAIWLGEGRALTTPIELSVSVRGAFGCNDAVAQVIAGRARARHYLAGATIIPQGEPRAEAHLLLLGQARAAVVTADGRLVRLLEFAPGDLFGAIGSQSLPAVEVSAVVASRTAAFAAAELLKLAEVHACVGVLLSRSLVRQLAALAEQVLARLTLSAVGRVHAELLRLARAGDGRRIDPPPVLADLAQRVQTTRETASRAVSALERRGIIRREPGALLIVAPSRLEALVI